MATTSKVLCLLLISQLISHISCQDENVQSAQDQTKLAFPNQRQYFGYPLSRAFQANAGAQQFTPVTEETSKEQQFFNAQGRQESQQQDVQQLQERQNALLQQYLSRQQYLQPATPSRLQQEQQYFQQVAAARQEQPAAPSRQQEQYNKAAEQYSTLLGVRFSAAPTVAKTQFSGNGFSFSY